MAISPFARQIRETAGSRVATLRTCDCIRRRFPGKRGHGITHLIAESSALRKVFFFFIFTYVMRDGTLDSLLALPAHPWIVCHLNDSNPCPLSTPLIRRVSILSQELRACNDSKRG